MPRIIPKDKGPTVIQAKTQADKAKKDSQCFQWWKANSKKEMLEQLLSTTTFLKQEQDYRFRQAALHARLYGNIPLFNFAGSNLTKLTTGPGNLPIDRPTMNVVQSCVDTLVSRITQSRPRPVFLTDDGDYKERNRAKALNTFIVGELYESQAYSLGDYCLRDATVIGTGVIKVFENIEKKVALERTLATSLLVDPNDAFYGSPRQLYELRLVDRSVLAEMFPGSRSEIMRAEQAYPDNGGDSQKTISDQVMVVEAWRLPSSKASRDGLHVIACMEGILRKDEYKKNKFPFAFLPYSPRLVGFWAQGLAEQLLGTQAEINRLLMTITASINLVGVPRVFVEKGSSIVKSHLNNQIGQICVYSGTKPIYEVAPCMPAEVYQQLQRLVQYAYQQAGISTMAAQAMKPGGLDSGEAIRNFDDLQSDRFATISQRYDRMFVDLSYLIMDEAYSIKEREGVYATVYTSKTTAKKVELPDLKSEEDPFVIQCFDSSSLPRDPAGRLEKVTEMIQSGMVSLQEGRRLLDFPDLQQEERLANASEERILQILDQIIEDGKYTPPDPFMNLALAEQKVTQYYNLYGSSKLEEEKLELLRNFFTGIQTLKMAAEPPAPSPQLMPPQANPEPLPTSPLVPNANNTDLATSAA